MNQLTMPIVIMFIVGAFLGPYLVPLAIAALAIVGILTVSAIYIATKESEEEEDDN